MRSEFHRRAHRALTLAAALACALFAACWAPAGSGAAIVDGPDSLVNAIAQASDGTLYVAGYFDAWGPITGGGAAVSASTAQLDRRFPDVVYQGHPGSIYAVAPDGSGGFYVGGAFSSLGGVPRSQLAHILPSGAVDDQWAPKVTSGGPVYAIAVSGSTVYVGGGFEAVDGQPRYGLAAIDANGHLTGWTAQLTGLNGLAGGYVLALATDGPTVYAGGSFTAVNGHPRNGLAAVDGSGRVTDWNPDPQGATLEPVDVITIADGTVYIGGTFTSMAGVPRNGLAAVHTSGTLTAWNPAPPDPETDPTGVDAITVSNSTVYVGGSFSRMGDQIRNGLAAITTDGTVTDWDPGPLLLARVVGDHNLPGIIGAIAISGSRILVAGQFDLIGGQPRHGIAALAQDGSVLGWDPAPPPGGGIGSITVSGPLVYLAGGFTMINSVPRTGLAAVDRDGRLTPWAPTPSVAADPTTQYTGGTAQSVTSVAVSGSTVYIAGPFDYVNRAKRHGLAAISRDGTLTPWAPDVPPTLYRVFASGSTVFITGGFTSVDGAPRANVAALRADNGALLPWNPSPDGNVEDLAIVGDTVYLAGRFRNVAGVPRHGVAAMTLAGTLTGWNPDVDGSVYAIAPAGPIFYLGGFFSHVASQSRLGAAAVDADGRVTPWDPHVDDAYGVVNSIAPAGDTVYLGGTFVRAGCATRPYVAAFSTTGALTGWNPGTGAPLIEDGIAVSGGSVILAGNFGEAGGMNEPWIARLGSSAAFPATSGIPIFPEPSVAGACPWPHSQPSQPPGPSGGGTQTGTPPQGGLAAWRRVLAGGLAHIRLTRRALRSGKARIKLTLPTPGRIHLRLSLLVHRHRTLVASATAAGSRRVFLRIRLSARGRKLVVQRHRLRASIRLSFTARQPKATIRLRRTVTIAKSNSRVR